MKFNQSHWRWFFILAALQAGAAFVALVTIPQSGSGPSVSRLAMLLIIAVFLAGNIYLALRLPGRTDRLARPRNALTASLLTIFLAAGLFLLRYLAPERLLPYYERLSPLLWYLLVTSLEFAVLCLLKRYGLHLNGLREHESTLQAAALACLILMLAFGFVVLTRVGITPDSAYWGEPAPPVLAWQLAIALVCGLIVLLAGLRWRLIPAMDGPLALVIWVLAVAVWLSVPMDVMKSSFYAPIGPPSNQSLPNSDAGYYDSMAQSLLIGYPYQGDIPTRPLYITFLALLHMLAGQRYGLIVAGQTLLLALIPVVLYFLGKRLHSRTAGIIAALFAIFRELNSLLISSQTRVSNTKTLLVDLPTVLLMLVSCLCFMRWMQRRGRVDALMAGGLFGILLLLRTQSLVLVPILLALALVTYGLRGRTWVVPAALFSVGILAVLGPWLAHNFLRSGHLALDAPFEYQVIASQYRYTGNLDLSTVNDPGKGLLGILVTFAVKDPGFVAGFIASHFAATMIDSVMALPLLARYDGLLHHLNLYWMSGAGDLSVQNVVLTVVYLSVIALGLGAGWKRLRWAGLAPLAFGLGYALANGIARFSGWRYDLPADWVTYFYFAVGAAELMGIAAALLGAKDGQVLPRSESAPGGTLRWRTAGILIAGLALVGALPWFAERMAAPRYASQTLPGLMGQLTNSPAVRELHVAPAQLQSFAANPQATLEVGRVLYPRFFIRDDGLAGTHPWPAFAVRNFPRMGFVLLNESRHDAVMPFRQADAHFEQGADAVVLGCQRQGFIEVRLVYFPQTDSAFISAPLNQSCDRTLFP